MTAKPKTVVNYIDKEEFLEGIVAYKKSCAEAKKKKKPKPQIPTPLAKCLMMIAKNLSKRANFSQYTFRDLMVSDGVENCVRYFDNFDPKNKKKNPFGYFSQICYYAFCRRIQVEKKELYIKYKLAQSGTIDDSQHQEGDDNGGEAIAETGLYDNISEFIGKFEANLKKNKVKNAKKVKLENFMED